MNISSSTDSIIFSASTAMETGKIAEAENSDADLRQASRDFEALFIHKMLQTMRKTIPENSLLDGGLVEDIYTDMLDQQVAQAAAERECMGIASIIYEDMSRRLGAEK